MTLIAGVGLLTFEASGTAGAHPGQYVVEVKVTTSVLPKLVGKQASAQAGGGPAAPRGQVLQL